MQTRQLLLDRARWTLGWMSDKELSFLAEVAGDLKANSIIYEIGSFCGKSTLAMADNAPDDCVIHCIDPWDYKIDTFKWSVELNRFDNGDPIIVDLSTFKQFCINLQDHVKSGKVVPHVEKWKDFIPTEKSDFTFIDGDHEYESVKHDILKAKEWTKIGGIIAGHDYPNYDGVFKAINEIFWDGVFVTDTIWWIRNVVTSIGI